MKIRLDVVFVFEYDLRVELVVFIESLIRMGNDDNIYVVVDFVKREFEEVKFNIEKVVFEVKVLKIIVGLL